MKIIAEIGTSHGGDLEKAKKLIDCAAESGADYIKFQWVYADEILHPNTGFVNLPTGKIPLYDRFRELEVEPGFFEECLRYTHEKGAKFTCSPFGLRSLCSTVLCHRYFYRYLFMFGIHSTPTFLAGCFQIAPSPPNAAPAGWATNAADNWKWAMMAP